MDDLGDGQRKRRQKSELEEVAGCGLGVPCQRSREECQLETGSWQLELNGYDLRTT